jgi:PPOX class probable F420-dependent enzyme
MAIEEIGDTTRNTVRGERGTNSTTTIPTGRAVEAVLAGLDGYRFLNLSTFRKNGVLVITTVLFAVANGKIFVWTTKDSGKAKRIRNNPAVLFGPSTRLGRPQGSITAATARILSVSRQSKARALTNREFGWLKKFFGLIWHLQGREEIYVEITPELGSRRTSPG